MIKLIFPDNSEKEFQDGITGAEIIQKLPDSVRKKALGCKIDDKIIDLETPIMENGKFVVITDKDTDSLEILRHSGAHIMAQAICRLYPGTKLGIGPTIEDGFYYDIECPETITEELFPKIEKEMQKIIKENYPVSRSEVSKEEALKFFKDDKYKVELITELEDNTITFYKQGEFTDLCRGPHLPSTGKMKIFKLLKTAGAYWRGKSENPQLQRIYATAFFSKDELNDYIKRLEEAKKRDHRKIGKQLELFSMHEEGPGFPFFHPNGMVLWNELLNFWREEHTKEGYKEISTPIILKRVLWEQSGHWDHYKDNMYFTKIDEEDFAIKPMNCPGGILVYKSNLHSYRELPMKIAEVGIVHRHEISGVLHGLLRVRKFTQDDAHIYMLPEQITDEIIGVYKLTDRIYKVFGFEYDVEISTRPEDYIGTEEMWDIAEKALIDALDKIGINYKINEGDGAFYGPKIDFHIKDCIGRKWQCATIQLDFAMPEKFNLVYIGDDGKEHKPVMLHRAILGSIERFIGILIEHFAGAFPVWIAPVQTKILTVTDRTINRAKELDEKLKEQGIRNELDLRNEKVGYKIREAQMQKIPYMIILGDKELETGKISVRLRTGEQINNITLEEFEERVKEKIKEKSLDL